MSVNDRELLFEAGTKGVDTLVDAVLDKKSGEHTLFLKAKSLRSRDIKRTYVEACLLVSQDYEQIAEILELEQDLVYIYAKMLYDTEGLGKLDKMELLDLKDSQERLVKLWALSQGLDFIRWRLGDTVSLEPTACLNDLFSTSMYKAKEAAFSGNDTENSKEALKWTKMSTDLARLIRAYSVDNTSAKADIEIALEEASMNFGSLADVNRDYVEPETVEDAASTLANGFSLDDLNRDAG